MPKVSRSKAVEARLKERVKELTCLYAIEQLAAKPGVALDDVLMGIAEIARRGWQYPEITTVRIRLDNRSYTTRKFREGTHCQSAEVDISGTRRGSVDVFYTKRRPILDEGPFLKEERKLIDAVAGQVAVIVQRREAEQEQANLQNQLRHADRLATIGQLTAGIAHELNEPLAGILGFAQLAHGCAGVPKEAKADLERIMAASLRAREIMKKLLLFSRQQTPEKTSADLNQVVEEGIYIFRARCAKEGIELDLSLDPKLPRITADPAQLMQVLVNLVVNAIQAMPDGGRLSVTTRAGPAHVALVVEDTGTGMAPDVIEKLFVPFFTTKDVGEGTGLGLPVAHGIVIAHGGTITVDSTPGEGTVFEVRLPLSNDAIGAKGN